MLNTFTAHLRQFGGSWKFWAGKTKIKTRYTDKLAKTTPRWKFQSKSSKETSSAFELNPI